MSRPYLTVCAGWKDAYMTNSNEPVSGELEHVSGLREWARGTTTVVAATELLIRTGFAQNCATAACGDDAFGVRRIERGPRDVALTAPLASNSLPRYGVPPSCHCAPVLVLVIHRESKVWI